MLFSIYAMFWLSWSLHTYFSPEHQHEIKVCLTNLGEKHLHSEEYGAVECSICHIAPPQAELLGVLSLELFVPTAASRKVNLGETPRFPASPHSISRPRAPPARLA